MYSRTGPREQGKRYSKGSKKPQKVRQAKQRYKHLKKKYKPLTGHSGGALLFNRNFSSLILRCSSDATPHRGTPGCTRTHLPTPACTHPRACMSVSSASASHTGTQDIGVQAGTHEGGSSTNKLYNLYITNLPI